jgi:SAM-dependent methyltransferase
MRADYAEIFQRPETVRRYQEVVYAPDTYSSAVSARQRAYLRDLARRIPQRRPVQHDFACGTGRAITMLHGAVRAAHGYDTSTAMLDQARACRVPAQLHEIAADGPLPVPATSGGPALVTVLRLLLNAADDVRDRAIGFAAEVLPDPAAGLLVVENHGNRGSLRHLGAARHAGDPWFAELSHVDVEKLLARHRFEIVERRGFALCPPGAYRTGWLRPIARRADAAATRLPVLADACVDVLYVARRLPRRPRANRSGVVLPGGAGRSGVVLPGGAARPGVGRPEPAP